MKLVKFLKVGKIYVLGGSKVIGDTYCLLCLQLTSEKTKTATVLNYLVEQNSWKFYKNKSIITLL